MDKEKTLEKVNIILRQTDYTHTVALEKLKEENGDHIQVIKQYMGITEKKVPEIKSVNQEIYRQLRNKMDNSIRNYNKKQEEKLIQETTNNN
uniref:Uncharacterized protein n=1 Tax=viral metagenome TaxID=1070528 RepID=A0A6C0BAR4_9ZZZZ